MKVAIPLFNSRVSPRFDFASKLLVTVIEEGMVKERHEYSLAGLNPIRRNSLLNELGINLMICGGISGFSERFLIGNGIEVIPLVQGEVDEVLNLFMKGKLPRRPFPFLQGRYCQRRGKRNKWRGGRMFTVL